MWVWNECFEPQNSTYEINMFPAEKLLFFLFFPAHSLSSSHSLLLLAVSLPISAFFCLSMQSFPFSSPHTFVQLLETLYISFDSWNSCTLSFTAVQHWSLNMWFLFSLFLCCLLHWRKCETGDILCKCYTGSSIDLSTAIALLFFDWCRREDV